MNKLVTIVLTIMLCSCGTSTKLPIPDFDSGPDVIVYKTKADYFYFVPVSLSADGKTILSYPHPSDVFINGELGLPTKLKKGYLLDNRGIGPRVAFTKYTYIDYAALTLPPTPEELLESILDADPLEEMYNCGKKSELKNLDALYALIKNKFQGAQKLK